MNNKSTTTLAIAVLLVITIAIESYFFYTTHTKQRVTISDLSTKNEELETSLAQQEQEYTLLSEAFNRERERNDEIEDRLEDAEDVLGTIVKIQNTDEELLQKYSKIYFLNEHYQPADLKKIDDDYIEDSRSQEQYIHGDVRSFLEDMFEEAENDGIDLQIISAFRSFDTQNTLKTGYTVTYGSGANTFSADQGYSEHQLGTAIDLSTKELGSSYENFGETEAYTWMDENAYKYGFTLSYPENNNYYIHEPWHWRFVGRDLAKHLHRNDLYFYDMDQRDIDKYLAEMFD
tara:strand:+ start:874 stop:1740 length:867 start_codon:yes stop_codon:yes gene_type:complete